MPYIAFIDMIGTRASATISNQEYTTAINDFNNSLKQVSSLCECTVYSYSDNAYVEVDKLSDLVTFFQVLRETLMNRHRYFTAAVDFGTLNAKKISLDKSKGFLMKFTAPATVDIYMQQCQFSGIGVSLSKKVVGDLIEENAQNAFCRSIYQPYTDNEYKNNMIPIYDLSYNSVILENLKYIMADYLLTTATNDRAGRYYITPIISMIKCINEQILFENLNSIVSLLSLNDVSPAFKSLNHNNEYSLYFLFALVDSVLSLREKNRLVDSTNLIKHAVTNYNVDHGLLIKSLPSVSDAVISNKNRKHFLNILYNMGIQNK